AFTTRHGVSLKQQKPRQPGLYSFQTVSWSANKTQARRASDEVHTALSRSRLTANVSATAKKARISRRHMYRLRKDNEDLAAAWQEAIALGTAALEDKAARRGAPSDKVRPPGRVTA
uniref:hypothetical protein n=1 Tax=Chromobacterium subtsugae TaxID=251747 RepID=UPI001C125D70